VQVPGILPTQAEEWYTCYIIEESLSMDNLFAFYMVFLYFKVGPGVLHLCVLLFFGSFSVVPTWRSAPFLGIGLGDSSLTR
jgi:hypothetical protein